jgi:hypothetical protein
MRGASLVGVAMLAAIVVSFAAATVSAAASELIAVPLPCARYAKDLGARIPERISAKQAEAAYAWLANAARADERARHCRAALGRAARGAK